MMMLATIIGIAQSSQDISMVSAIRATPSTVYVINIIKGEDLNTSPSEF
jgi:hypothetical protein